MADFVKVLNYDDMFVEDKLKQARKSGIDAYEMTAVMGMEGRNIFSVWMDKVDMEKKSDLHYYNIRKKMNRLLMSEFCEDTGRKINEGGFFTSLKYEHMNAMIDGFIEGEDAGLTCRMSHVGEGLWQDNSIPLIENVQAQWCMALTGFDTWYLACLLNDRTLMWKCIDREEELINKMLEAANDFWENHVKTKNIPDADGSYQCGEAYYYQYIQGDNRIGWLDIEEGEYDTLCEDILKLKEDEEKIKKALYYKIGRLKKRIGFSEFARTANHYIRWKTKPRKVFNKYKFACDYHDIYIKYCDIDFDRPLSVHRYSTNPYAVKTRKSREKKR